MIDSQERRYVVDASVGAKWVLPELDSDAARRLLEMAATGAAELIAPDLYVPEITNILWKRCHLLGDITSESAAEALKLALLTLPGIVPSAELSAQALQLALAFGQPVYDCLYVSLALRERCSLVTADTKLARVFGPVVGGVLTVNEVSPA